MMLSITILLGLAVPASGDLSHSTPREGWRGVYKIQYNMQKNLRALLDVNRQSDSDEKVLVLDSKEGPPTQASL